MSPAKDYCLIGSSSDVGRVRQTNEDSMVTFDSPNGLVVVVCDGMGGHVGGQIASQTSVNAIHDFLTNNVFDDARDAMSQAIMAANEAVLAEVAQRPDLQGMGSTCVMLMVRNGQAYYAHVGDSRIYFVADKQIYQLTKDQSYVQQLVDAGQITQEEAAVHPNRNEITNAIGYGQMTPPIICEAPITPEAGNCFILCSDGLYTMMTDDTIEQYVSRHDVPIQQRADTLVELANQAGGKDNVTVQLVEFTVSSDQLNSVTRTGVTPKKSKKSLYMIPASALLVVLVIGGILIFKPSQKAPQVTGPNPVTHPIAPKTDTLSDVKIDTFQLKQIVNGISHEEQRVKVDSVKDKNMKGYSAKVEEPKDSSVFVQFNASTSTLSLFLKKEFKPDTKEIVIRLTGEGKSKPIVLKMKVKNEPSAPKPKAEKPAPKSAKPAPKTAEKAKGGADKVKKEGDKDKKAPEKTDIEKRLKPVK
jgi:serine/threonine protein phosphatase PrpC